LGDNASKMKCFQRLMRFLHIEPDFRHFLVINCSRF
jgi:hypothetical protein